MVLSLLRTTYSWFRPFLDAVFSWRLPWKYRWRLLLLQPLSLITYSISAVPYLFSRPFTVDWIHIAPGRCLRVLVFKAPSAVYGDSKLRPLHLDCHGGAFIGGLPESDAAFCNRVARETGAVVISTTYRYAPKHAFPAAIDDVDAVVAYLGKNAETRYGADPSLMTVSGFSAGGNLALSSAISIPGAVRAAVVFYAAIEMRLSPWQKQIPPNFPKRDPLSFLMPLYDSYPAPARASNMDNPRLSPIIADLDSLPDNILMVVPGIDILVHEQNTFIERLKEDAAKDPRFSGRRFEIEHDEKGFHGYLERA
jgi:acetyl esterase/lipase